MTDDNNHDDVKDLGKDEESSEKDLRSNPEKPELTARERSNLNLIPTVPGQVLNPKGRPKSVSLTDLLKKFAKNKASTVPYFKKVCDKLGLDPEETTLQELIVYSTMLHGTAGKPRQVIELWNRMDGKVTDKIEFQGNVKAYVGISPDDWDDDQQQKITQPQSEVPESHLLDPGDGAKPKEESKDVDNSEDSSP